MKSITIKSKVTINTVYDLKTILSSIKNGTAIVWQFNGIIIGNITDESVTWSGGIEPTEKLIVEARFFNADKEYYFRKSGDKLTGRLREDKIGNESEIVDVPNYLWGTKGDKIKNSFTKLSEDNGMHLVLPGDYSSVNPKNRVCITIRNYIEYNDRHMAGYVDARFVDIKI